MKEIQTTHMKPGIVSSDEYYTPLPLIQSLGKFDLDPCSPANPHWCTATTMLTKEDDGLSAEWQGRVWLNPPYSAPLISQFMQRMAKHGNGIALVVPKFGSKMFREWVFPYCDGIFILDKRIKFYDKDWVQQRSPICQSVLIAYGEDNLQAILNSGNEGTMLYTQRAFDTFMSEPSPYITLVEDVKIEPVKLTAEDIARIKKKFGLTEEE